MSLIKKIIESHLLDGKLLPGEMVTISIDQTLNHDLNGTLSALALEEIGLDKVKTELSVQYCDHNSIEAAPENADDHVYLKSAAQRFGMFYSKSGNGICHSLHYQRFAKPGKTLLGADSHTPTSGALGMLAIGSGGLNIALAMAGQGFRFAMPKVINVRLSGRLETGVAAKDIALELLRRFTVKGGRGCALEFTGEGMGVLSVPERATIANMCTELGATTAIFPSDQKVADFLKAQNRADDWIELLPKADEAYDEEIEINLSSLEPLVAKPHMPDNVEKVKNLQGTIVQQVFIGSCTNASYMDLAKVANVLKGHKVHPDINLSIAAGSRQVLEQLSRDGYLTELIASGARILECSCGPCVGSGQAPASNGVSLRTSNRNFMGRGGTPNAEIYLASCEVAAATALCGRITDPRILDNLADRIASIQEPDTYIIDDSMIIPPKGGGTIKTIKGPNIKPLPVGIKMEDRAIKAIVATKLGDNITTDDIIPGTSQILKYVSNMPKLAEFTFCYLDPDFAETAKKNKNNVIVGGDNYGQGSSRENAAIILLHLGVRCVIAKSFARIHKENLINFGIIPLEFSEKQDYDRIAKDDRIIIEEPDLQLAKNHVEVKLIDKDMIIWANLVLSKSERHILQAGGALAFAGNALT